MKKILPDIEQSIADDSDSCQDDNGIKKYYSDINLDTANIDEVISRANSDLSFVESKLVRLIAYRFWVFVITLSGFTVSFLTDEWHLAILIFALSFFCLFRLRILQKNINLNKSEVKVIRNGLEKAGEIKKMREWCGGGQVGRQSAA